MAENNSAAAEASYIFDKKVECAICGNNFTSKVLKTNKAKFLGTDEDLRPRYSGIDTVKYDIYMCPKCGYAAVAREFNNVTPKQRALIKEEIASKFERVKEPEGYYTYDYAILRYKMALLAAIKKPAKISECAFLCLKLAWLNRGVQETLCPSGDKESLSKEAKQIYEDSIIEETTYLREAYEGFTNALAKEYPPICGMDESTLNYLMSVLAFRNADFDIAAKYGYAVLSSRSATSKLKDKERDLMDKIKSDNM